MRPWLAGDLRTLRLPEHHMALRDCVLSACHRRLSLVPLYRALADRDPEVLSGIALSSDCAAHPVSLLATLEVAEKLSTVVSPDALFSRVFSLEPALRPKALAVAVAGWGRAEWVLKVARQGNMVSAYLQEMFSVGQFDAAVSHCIDAGELLPLANWCSERDATPVLIAARSQNLDATRTLLIAVRDQTDRRRLVAEVAAVWSARPEVLFRHLREHARLDLRLSWLESCVPHR